VTAIEWTDETWNPVTGCSKVSIGCDNCYAENLSLRFGWSKLPWTPENAAANVVLHPERLDKPKTWRTPRRVFVNSMSDLFHENIPDEFIGRVFWVMEHCQQHTFQVLTKRPRRAAEFLRRYYNPEQIVGLSKQDIVPIQNVWLGVSIESWRFNWRADVLREIPAAIRFISAEPLLDTLYGARPLVLDGIHWLIAGGESGPHYRPTYADWIRQLRDACTELEVAFFFKQWGGRTPKANGREIDGREWSEYPEIVTP